MRTPSTELPALTGLRGFAALWVLLLHVWFFAGEPALQLWSGGPAFGPFFNLGWAGVDVFFCLSAFLLAMPFARWRYDGAPRPDTGRYLWRRTLRIYPAYLLQLGILLGIATLTGEGRLLDLRELVAHVFLWFNMGRDWVAPLVGVWFTLPIEFAFYLLLPFLAPMLDRGRWPWLLVGAVAVTLGWRVLAYGLVAAEPVPIRVVEIERLLGRIDQFVIGMLAGAAFVASLSSGWRPRRRALWFWGGVAGCTLLLAALYVVRADYWDGHPLLFVWHGLFSASLLPVLLAAAWGDRSAVMLFGSRVLRHLGRVSFGVYLWHMPIVLAVLPHIPAAWGAATKLAVLLAIVLPATLIVAQASFVLVERPLLERGRRARLPAA
ncbi:acyltransferase [Dokdonella sp.]|uniref:acyltransferase family protein n=1 Tax=Dokdonella sp. TaxID=2291710 RepID=UPI00321F9FD1